MVDTTSNISPEFFYRGKQFFFNLKYLFLKRWHIYIEFSYIHFSYIQFSYEKKAYFHLQVCLDAYQNDGCFLLFFTGFCGRLRELFPEGPGWGSGWDAVWGATGENTDWGVGEGAIGVAILALPAKGGSWGVDCNWLPRFMCHSSKQLVEHSPGSSGHPTQWNLVSFLFLLVL